MRNTITYPSRFSILEFVASVRKSITKSFMRMAVSLSRLFSFIMEERISPMQSLRALHLTIALTFAILPADMPLLLRMLLIAWFALTVIQVRNGEKEE